MGKIEVREADEEGNAVDLFTAEDLLSLTRCFLSWYRLSRLRFVIFTIIRRTRGTVH